MQLLQVSSSLSKDRGFSGRDEPRKAGVWHRSRLVYRRISGLWNTLFPDAKTRIEQLAESVEIIRRIWTCEKADFRGKYYKIIDLVSYPKPLQKPHPPIWIGGKGYGLLRIAAQYASHANFAQCSVGEFKERLLVLKRHYQRIGKSSEDIEKLGTESS